MSKFYAVKEGRKPGIYQTWQECQEQILKYSGAVYKSFDSKEAAEAFMYGSDSSINIQNKTEFTQFKVPDTYAFVDGSYNKKTKMYGYGGILSHNGIQYTIQGNDSDKNLVYMNNVAGEICGAMAAITKAKELNIKEITIFYDYEGIYNWAVGNWQANKTGTKRYAKFMKDTMDEGMKIHFVHVKGHKGIPGNEEVDRLAKESVGLSKK